MARQFNILGAIARMQVAAFHQDFKLVRMIAKEIVVKSKKLKVKEYDRPSHD